MKISLKSCLAALVAPVFFSGPANAQDWTPPGPITMKISLPPVAVLIPRAGS